MVVNVLNKVLSAVLYLVMAGSIMVVWYGIYDSVRLDVQAEASEVVFSSGAAGDEELASLAVQNPEIVGRITLEGTRIDYPVLQASDNEKYLSRDYRGEFAANGSAFLDYRNARDWSDRFQIIYGHRMSNRRMFSDIGLYEERSFLAEHSSGRLIVVSGESWELKVLALAEIEADDKRIYDDALVSENLSEVLEYLSGKIMVGDLSDYRGGRVLVLSTCSTKRKNARDILILEIR